MAGLESELMKDTVQDDKSIGKILTGYMGFGQESLVHVIFGDSL